MREYNKTIRQRYMQGTAAVDFVGRQSAAAPQKAPVVPAPRTPKRSTNVYTYRNRQKALQMNGKYVLFLVIAAVFCLLMCVQYLNVQSQISEKTMHVNSLSSEIAELTVQNDATDYAINSFIDIENICKIAKEQLGMVEATGKQVTMYDKSSSEYMKQSGDIPTQE